MVRHLQCRTGLPGFEIRFPRRCFENRLMLGRICSPGPFWQSRDLQSRQQQPPIDKHKPPVESLQVERLDQEITRLPFSGQIADLPERIPWITQDPVTSASFAEISSSVGTPIMPLRTTPALSTMNVVGSATMP